MQDNSARLAVGLDIGTTKVRCIVGQVDPADGTLTIVGSGEASNNGMRKGVVVNMVNTAHAIDKALEAAERMSGHQIHQASVSINGTHITSLSSKGVVAVGTSGHEITPEDLLRAEEAAAVVQLPANREILQVTPRSYQLDGQSNVKDPLGMTGVRLEVDAQVITALTPHVRNLQKACEMTETAPTHLVLAGLASAKAVLSEHQMENGVVVIDIGGSTTNLAVYEEGDLQHAAVLPMGSVNITNDLAIGLKTDLDVADAVKLQHADAARDKGSSKEATVTVNGEKHSFKLKDVDMIVEARLEELFELINKELKAIGRAAKLPGGAVLVGGGANLKSIAEFAKHSLQLPARTGTIKPHSGVADVLKNPAYAAAAGLLIIDLEGEDNNSKHGFDVGGGANQAGELFKNAGSKISDLLKKFKA